MLTLNHLDKMSAFERACKQALSIDALETLMKTAFSDICVKTFSYHQIDHQAAPALRSARVVTHYGYPESWQTYYRSEKQEEADPFFVYAVNQNRPFWWSEALPNFIKSDHGQKVLGVVRERGLKSGLVLPVYRPGEQSGFFALGYRKAKSDFSQAKIDALQWACQLAHNRHVDLSLAAACSQRTA